MILEEGPFSSWDSESGEVGMPAEPFTTLGVLKVLVSFSRIERMRENLTLEAMKEYFWDTPL